MYVLKFPGRNFNMRDEISQPIFLPDSTLFKMPISLFEKIVPGKCFFYFRSILFKYREVHNSLAG